MTDTLTTPHDAPPIVTAAERGRIGNRLASIDLYVTRNDPYAAAHAVAELAALTERIAARVRPPFGCESLAVHTERTAPSALNPNCVCHKVDGVRLVHQHEAACPERGV